MSLRVFFKTLTCVYEELNKNSVEKSYSSLLHFSFINSPVVCIRSSFHHTLTTTILSANWFENSSNFGAIILHGPHQVAWKSTTTRRSPADSNLASKSACERKKKRMRERSRTGKRWRHESFAWVIKSYLVYSNLYHLIVDSNVSEWDRETHGMLINQCYSLKRHSGEREKKQILLIFDRKFVMIYWPLTFFLSAAGQNLSKQTRATSTHVLHILFRELGFLFLSCRNSRTFC